MAAVGSAAGVAGVAAGERAAGANQAGDEATGADAGAAVTAVAATSLDAVPADLVAPSQDDPTVIDPPIPAAPPVPQPKPVFTSSGRSDQAGPPFSESRPAGQVPAQPAPPFSRSTPSEGPPTKPQPAYESPHYGGSNAQYGQYGNQGRGSNAQYAQHPGPNAQYAGPSQPYPDLARQYSAGSGGSPRRRARRGRAIALIGAAVVVAAAVGAGAGLALNGNGSGSSPSAATSNSASAPATAGLPGSVQALDDPTNTIPTGWTQQTVQPSDAGTHAGFRIAVPPGWTEQRSGQATYFHAPDGGWLMEIDLTPHTYSNMLTEAKYLESQVVAKDKFPNYKRAGMEAVPIRGTNGAFWQFTWVLSGSAETRSDDILFVKPTAAGSQSYAIYFRAPAPGNDWNNKYLPVFKKMLRTFQTESS